MIIDETDYLMHYGVLRRSGRYPWGSGDDPENKRNKDFLDYVADMRSKGLSEVEIARGMDITTTQLRAAKTIAKNQQKAANITYALQLKDKGYSNVAIGAKMGINESSVRSLLADGQKEKTDILTTTSAMLKKHVDEKEFLDIGVGVENHLGISKEKLNAAVAILKEEGYGVQYYKVKQLGTSNETSVKVLVKPNTPYTAKNLERIQQVTSFSDDGGRSYLGIKPPLSINSKRVGVRYAEDGGSQADGVIYVRPGVDDISLGKSRYAQVRIAVDGTHYLKGMAMYKDDLPDGVDLVFNTNKSNTGNKLDAMKALKDDPDNPFGATVRQLTDEKGNVTSSMNLVNEEGRWEQWSKSLSTQVLSKQKPALAKAQLDMTYEQKKQDLADIKKLTNPAVRKLLLEKYADGTDSSAVHLKAHFLPRQASHVILPVNSLKDTEVYAPNYRNGERVVLVRYPHGGKFEIPELVVNNRHPEAKKLLGNAPDAIGINSRVAERLSGADFDGDTVLVIPNNSNRVATEPALSGLKNFDPKIQYKAYDGMPKMSAKTKQVEMGKVSNLITDMTLHGANNAELARAVRHSMVVIDAEKHNLNYKQSKIDNGIAQLERKYQYDPEKDRSGGASTLISRATSEQRVLNRKPRSAADGGPIDRATGERVYVNTGESYVNGKGKVVENTFKSTKLAEAKDANTLSSGTEIEKIYATHSNRLKDLANQARKDAVNTEGRPYNKSAKAAYSKEVADLNHKLSVALANAPLERQAQIFANTTVSAKTRANPNMDPADLKKIKSQALAEARARTQAKKHQIDITDREWEAIQAGAISNDRLNKILNNADLDKIKALATPRTTILMTATKTNRAKQMLAQGYSQAEVADAVGVSLSTLKTSLA